MAVYIIFAVVLLLMLFIVCIPVKIEVLFEKSEQNNKTDVSVKYLFFNHRLNNKKAKKTDTENPAPKRSIKWFLDIYKIIKEDIYDTLNFFKSKTVVVENIKLKIDFGYPDAASTGLMTGVINAGAYNAVSVMCNNLKVLDWSVDIAPDFENEKFDMSFYCIGKMKTAHIIVAGIRVLKMLFKIRNTKKGRD